MKLRVKKIDSRNSFELLLSLWQVISKKRKKQLLLTIFFMFLNALSEIISLSIILPFISLLTDKEKIWSNIQIRNIANIFNIQNANQLLFITFIFLIFAVILTSLVRLSNLWLANRMAQIIGVDLSCEAFKRTLYQPYSSHLKQNSSQVISTINKSIDGVVAVLDGFLQLISGIVITISIFFALLIIDWETSIVAIIIFGSTYAILSLITRRKLIGNSRYNVSKQRDRLKCLQEGLGGIRDVILTSTQSYFINLYKILDAPLRFKSAENVFLAASPKYIIEGLSITFICSLAILTFRKEYSYFNSLAVLGTFALGSQKLLPAMQIIYRSLSSIRSKKFEIIDTLTLLNQKIYYYSPNKNKNKKINFNSIKLKNINFAYAKNTKNIFQNFNLEIKSGDKIGIIGKTGSGKSTLVDIVMGLLKPTNGVLEIDSKNINDDKNSTYLNNWKNSIAHVPQNIFLSDGSFAENIAFGIPKNEINMSKVRKAAKKAEIADFIESNENKYETPVGERGIRLSGGQRQRIGIARAFYRDCNLLILDEATSALDEKTEDSIMDTINSIDSKITLLIITHRIRTVSRCDRIIEIKANKS